MFPTIFFPADKRSRAGCLPVRHLSAPIDTRSGFYGRRDPLLRHSPLFAANRLRAVESKVNPDSAIDLNKCIYIATECYGPGRWWPSVDGSHNLIHSIIRRRPDTWVIRFHHDHLTRTHVKAPKEPRTKSPRRRCRPNRFDQVSSSFGRIHSFQRKYPSACYRPPSRCKKREERASVV